MPVRTTMVGQSRKHQAKAVEQFGSRAEGAADAGNTRTLAQCQRGRYIQHFIDLRSGSLRHPPPCVGRKRFQIAPRSFGIQDTQRQRRFPGTGNAGDGDDPVQRDIDINIFQVMDSRTANPDRFRCGSFCPDSFFAMIAVTFKRRVCSGHAIEDRGLLHDVPDTV